MNNQLQKLLVELKLNIELESILAFIDGNLGKTASIKMKKVIDSNPELLKFVNKMDLLMSNPNYSIPPARIHKTLLNTMGIKKKSLMDISLTILSNGLDVISGLEFLTPLSPIPAFRSDSKSELFFNKKLDDYNITCICDQIDNLNISIHFKISSHNESSIKNIRFKLLFENELIKSLLTNTAGMTKSVVINKGYYNVSIIKNTILGNINLDVS